MRLGLLEGRRPGVDAAGTTVARPTLTEPLLVRTIRAAPAAGCVIPPGPTIEPTLTEPLLVRTIRAAPAAGCVIPPGPTIEPTLTELASTRTVFAEPAITTAPHDRVTDLAGRARAVGPSISVTTLMTVAAHGVGNPRAAVADRLIAALAPGPLVVGSMRLPLVAPGPATLVAPLAATVVRRGPGAATFRSVS
ncbi:MAG: hypothetical protein ACRCYX_08075 [Dermatophilaceae bacterium]